jgi:hypothetical protein
MTFKEQCVLNLMSSFFCKDEADLKSLLFILLNYTSSKTLSWYMERTLKFVLLKRIFK